MKLTEVLGPLRDRFNSPEVTPINPDSVELVDPLVVARAAYEIGGFYKVRPELIERGAQTKAYLVTEETMTEFLLSISARKGSKREPDLVERMKKLSEEVLGNQVEVGKDKSIIYLKKSDFDYYPFLKHELYHSMVGTNRSFSQTKLEEAVITLLDFRERNRHIPLLPKQEKDGSSLYEMIGNKEYLTMAYTPEVFHLLTAMRLASVGTKPIKIKEIADHYFDNELDFLVFQFLQRTPDKFFDKTQRIFTDLAASPWVLR